MSFINIILSNFKWYRKLIKGTWWKVKEDNIDSWGATATYWTRSKPEESDEPWHSCRILKEESS